MANTVKTTFLRELTARFGSLERLNRSQSLYAVGDDAARVYIRYSKRHEDKATFYGLREEDLRELAGHRSAICFLWDGQAEPLCVPYAEYEDVFQTVSPAGDGQYKVQVYLRESGVEFYIARAGRFSVDGHLGWNALDGLMNAGKLRPLTDLSHPQVQALLGAIGEAKGFDVWIPQSDRPRMDWSVTMPFKTLERLPLGYDPVANTLAEVDVIWINRGANTLQALFEVEHSTPIYSGLLRFNDIHLTAPNMLPRFSVVSNSARRDQFVRQLRRPTFQASGLDKVCTFLNYRNVFDWHVRIRRHSEPGY